MTVAAPLPASRHWSHWRTTDFARLRASGAAAQAVAVLPVAATEQHGPHLPLCVDSALVEGVIAASLPHLPPTLHALFLPTQAVGFSPEHLAFPGTLSFSAETLIRIWTEIGEAVARTGIRRLLLLNGHGGQVGAMDLVARDLRARCGLIVYSSSWFSLPLPDAVQGLFSPHEHRFGIHAGDIETSMMLHLHPERVAMEQARDFRSSSEDRAARHRILGDGRSAKLGWQMQDYNRQGAAGNAAAATAEKGAATVAAAGWQLALLLQEIASLPLSTLVASPDLGDEG
ncbi:creatininase family protein [Xylophilus ampelinus]|uniref:Creatinine amidohydrolase n=1 Tax=Xylophilus ampelinus TaxID=54067 RepID=A0A318SXD2_9BURK|nr:creatininase family protein [Xylophilus ampelinus]MCS4510622.1 creatininase family protein [Xylophilus ampelinus]PYE76313.1 creatinine amidohydrolase [Xylophilus ampelinus]